MESVSMDIAVIQASSDSLSAALSNNDNGGATTGSISKSPIPSASLTVPEKQDRGKNRKHTAGPPLVRKEEYILPTSEQEAGAVEDAAALDERAKRLAEFVNMQLTLFQICFDFCLTLPS